MSTLRIIDRSDVWPADLSKLGTKCSEWLYLDVKPRGEFQGKRQHRTPQGYRPPWKPKARTRQA